MEVRKTVFELNTTLETISTVMTSVTSWFTDVVTIFFNTELVIFTGLTFFFIIAAFCAGLILRRGRGRGRR